MCLCVCSFPFVVFHSSAVSKMSSFLVTALVTIGLLGLWNSEASSVAAAGAAGTGSYRIRSRPPPGTTHQQPSRSSSTGMSRNNNNWQDVYIAGFLALSDHEIEAPLGQGVMPAITLALRHLANISFLHDYRLRLLYNDTKVLHPHRSFPLFFDDDGALAVPLERSIRRLGNKKKRSNTITRMKAPTHPPLCARSSSIFRRVSESGQKGEASI